MDIYFEPNCNKCIIYAADLHDACNISTDTPNCPLFGNCHVCENYDSEFCELCEYEE